jgi:hypothetical protein
MFPARHPISLQTAVALAPLSAHRTNRANRPNSPRDTSSTMDLRSHDVKVATMCSISTLARKGLSARPGQLEMKRADSLNNAPIGQL